MREASIVLNVRRCSWGKCFFCGYGKLEGIRSFEEFEREVERLFERLEGCEHLKVFGSGSFLDERQFSREMVEHFLERCERLGIRKLTVESRPEFVSDERLRQFKGRGFELEVAIGLETADEKLLRRLRKGFGLRDYERAAKILKRNNVGVRTYLLVNLPWVKDPRESLRESVSYALRFSDSVVLINLLPHWKSELFELWLRGEWRFLSKSEFLELTRDFASDPRVELDPETFRFVPLFPKELRLELKGVGEEFLTHPHFEVWQDYLRRWYAPPEGRVPLFLPCTRRKPYSASKTHRLIEERLRGFEGKLHLLVISNAGVVPMEFEHYYPFNSYDWDERLETEEVKRRYVEVTKRRVEAYLSSHLRAYGERVLCYLRHDSESYKALRAACEELGMELRNLLDEETYLKIRHEAKPLQRAEALSAMERNLRREISA